jgi:hypothetical protein
VFWTPILDNVFRPFLDHLYKFVLK